MEVVGSIASDIAKDLYSQAKRQARYVFCFNNIVEDFKSEKQKLKLTQESIHKRAVNAKNNTEKIDCAVQKWLEDAQSHIVETEELEKETEIKKKCFLAWCPNCIWQYRLGKKLVKKKQKLTELNANSQFKSFARLATLPGMEYHASDDFVYFESRKAAYEQLMESLPKGERFRVGLYGMGGSGKTNLVTEVGKQVEKLKLFDKVIYVVVSSSPDIRIIQGNIASSIGLKFVEEQEPERARRLWLRLTNGERILIIMDDVWGKLDFKAVGIPYDNNPKGCRVLLTSRSLEVCNGMDCQEAIELSLLTKDESWSLFQKHASISEESSNALKNVALEITNECKGLPVAIAAVASTLRNKPIDDWEVALETLRQPKSLDDVDDDLKKVYACLRLSYDNLKNEKAKSLFLLCSFYPEDYNINVEDLTRFGIGLGLFGVVNSYRRARSQAIAAKNKLIDSCLLLEAKEGQCVKMHDLVRDVALWTGNKEIQVIKGSNKHPNELRKNAILQETTLRYLGCHEMGDYPEILNLSMLEILLVDRVGGYDKQVPDEFFKGMKELRVLVLMNKYLFKHNHPLLQQSIQLLTNLRTLHLRAWRLGELCSLKNLERLETLELHYCVIDELPSEIIQLKCLKLLYLSNCEFRKNPYEIIGGCSQLEELGVFNVVTSDGCEWGDGEEIFTNFFVQDGSFPTLQRYGIEIGGSSTRLEMAMGKLIYRGLSIRCFEAWTSNKIVKDLVQRAEVLHLQKIPEDYRLFSPYIVEAIGGMNELVQLKLEFCSHVECLIDGTNLLSRASSTVFSKLVKLEVKDMDHLEELCRGPPPGDSFLNLEKLKIDGCSQLNNIFRGKLNFYKLKVMRVRGCPMLTFLFVASVARSLVLLERLEIHGCKKLENIFIDDQKNEINEGDHEISQDDNDHIQDRKRTLMLPKLKSLKLSECDALEFVLPISFASGGGMQLEELEVSVCTKLKFIFGQNQAQGELLHMNLQETILPSLPSTRLSLRELPNFINMYEVDVDSVAWQSGNTKLLLIPLHTAQCLSRQSSELFNIKVLQLNDCSNLSSLFTVSTAQRILLETLEISRCERLEFIVTDMEDRAHESHGSIFPLLRDLYVNDCKILKFIFPATFSKGLAQLNSICIRNVPELKYVLGEYLGEDQVCYQNQNEIHIDFPALDFIGLFDLPNMISFCPNNVHLRCPSLAGVGVDKCSQLGMSSISYFIRCLEATQVDVGLTNPKKSWLRLSDCFIECIFQLEEHPIDAPPVTSALRSMTLDNLPGLSYICKGPTQVLSLQCLADLGVYGCNKLRAIFSASILRSLPQLTRLRVKNCEQLEQIMENSELEDQITLNNGSQLVCFPNLKGLMVHHCNNLLRLFSFSSTHVLGKLNLTKDKASDLQDFFVLYGDATVQTESYAQEGKQFFELQAKLPSIPEPREGFKWQTKKACVIYVHDCPKLNLTTTAIPADTENEIKENPLEPGSPQNSSMLIESIKEITLKESTRNDIPILENLTIAASLIDSQQFFKKGSITEFLSNEQRECEESKVTTETLKQADMPSNHAHTAMGLTDDGSSKDSVVDKLQPLDSIEASHSSIFSLLPTSQSSTFMEGSSSNVDIPASENDNKENPLELGSLQDINPNNECKMKEIINENLDLEIISNLPKAPEDRNSEGIEATSKSELPPLQAKTNQIMLVDTETKRRQQSQTQESICPIIPQAQFIEEKSSPIDSSILIQSTKEITIREGVQNDIPTSENLTMAAALIDSQLVRKGSITEFLSNEQVEWGENEVTIETPEQADMPLNHANDAMQLADDSSPKASALEKLRPFDYMEVPHALISSCSPTSQSPTSIEGSSSNVDIPTSVLPVEAPPLSPQVCASTEELVDIRGLFKIDGRRASLLNEAFAKYPHLWEWCKRFRPKYCKWGYKSLADMLVLLNTETPKAMNESKREEFRNLLAELESFGFEEGWLASIYGKVMEVQVDNEKLKRLAELESQEIALLDKLNNVRLELGRVRNDLSKYDRVFGS